MTMASVLACGEGEAAAAVSAAPRGVVVKLRPCFRERAADMLVSMHVRLFLTAIVTMAGCGGRMPLGDVPLDGGGIGIGDGGFTGDRGDIGGPIGDPADATPPGEPVHGTVVDVEGRPYPGVELRLGGATTITDIDGHFDVANVPATYDVSIVLYGTEGYVFNGLSRRDPTLRIYDRFSLEIPTYHARVTVTMPSAGASTSKAVTFFELTDTVSFHSYSVDTVDNSTTFYPYWTGPSAVGIRFHALQYEVDPATNAPTHFTGYDVTDRTIADGTTIDWTPVWKGTVFSEATIVAKAVTPASYDLAEARLFIKPTADASFFYLASSRPSGADLSLLVPDVPGATFRLDVSAGSSRGVSTRSAANLTPRSPPPLLELEEVPVLGSPADRAVIGIGTIFQWTNPTARASFLRVFFPDQPSHPSFYFVNGTSSVAVPDFSNRGILLPRNAVGQWAVVGTSAVTVDELAAQGATRPDLPQTTSTLSSPRSFTTQ